MPAAINYYAPGESERRGLDYFNSESRERQEKYKKAWDYYLGKQQKFLKVKEEEPDDNVILNVVRMVVDRTVNFLYPQVPEFYTIDGQTVTESPSLQWVYDMFTFNGGLSFFHKAMIIGMLSGHVYVRIVPPNTAIGEVYPKLVPLSPKNVQTYWRSGDFNEVLWHEVSWKSGDVQYVIDFINNGGSWSIRQYKYEKGWELMPEKSGEWDSPYSPIVQWQHLPNPESFYGLAEIDDITLQDSLNLVMSEATRILRYHASPRTVVKGIEAEDIVETSIDNLWVIENPEASVENLEMVSQLEASRQIASLFYDSFLSLTRTVLLRGEVKDFQRVTNTGVRTVFMDSLAKRNTFSNQYGQGIANVVHRAALVSGLGDAFTVSVKHIDPLPLDELEQARVDKLKLEMGTMSRKMIVLRENRSWDELIEQIQEEWQSPIFIPMNTVAAENPATPNNENLTN